VFDDFFKIAERTQKTAQGSAIMSTAVALTRMCLEFDMSAREVVEMFRAVMKELTGGEKRQA